MERENKIRVLSKKEVQFIEDYLKEQGVKYWDVRIELIDHIASKLEANPNLVLDRYFLIRNFGTSISLEEVIIEKAKTVNNKMKRLWVSEFKQFFKSTHKMGLFSVFILLYAFVFLKCNAVVFKVISLGLFCIPLVITAFNSIKNWIQKNYSLHLQTALFYNGSTFLLFNSMFQISIWFNLYESTSETTNAIIFTLIIMYLFLSVIGYSVFLNTEKFYTQMFKKFIAV